VQFFPDENGLVSQQVEGLLAASDPVNEQSVSSSTAPLQGLPALEYLLFGENASSQFTSTSRRCEVSKAISAHLARRAAILNADWLLQVDSFVAGGQSSLGKTTVAVESAISNIRDNELGNPLGLRGQGAASPELVETPWAKISFATLDSALTSIENIMVGDGNQAGLANLLSQYQNAEYSDQLLALITDVKATLNDENNSLFNAVSDGQAATRLTALFDGDFSELRNQMQTLGQRMGIDDGFNADDGD
jgi:predicted lipoprotein